MPGAVAIAQRNAAGRDRYFSDPAIDSVDTAAVHSQVASFPRHGVLRWPRPPGWVVGSACPARAEEIARLVTHVSSQAPNGLSVPAPTCPRYRRREQRGAFSLVDLVSGGGVESVTPRRWPERGRPVITVRTGVGAEEPRGCGQTWSEPFPIIGLYSESGLDQVTTTLQVSDSSNLPPAPVIAGSAMASLAYR